jgi:hypothetical protein
MPSQALSRPDAGHRGAIAGRVGAVEVNCSSPADSAT